MQTMTFDEILAAMCDRFDSIIAPQKIGRSNTNVIYLLLKAIAKGFEVVDSVVCALANRFLPDKCTDRDLLTTAKLVGTMRYEGSPTGLQIICENKNEYNALTLPAGIYSYKYNDDWTFTFTVASPTAIAALGEKEYIATSSVKDDIPVTAQASITVQGWADAEMTVPLTIPPELAFSCLDNGYLQGTPPETTYEFRKRILKGIDVQNPARQLEAKLLSLPYVLDCRVRYNNTDSPVAYGTVTIDPAEVGIFFDGEPRQEVAELVANYLLCPTAQGAGATELQYEDDVLVTGGYPVYLNPFEDMQYKVHIDYMLDSTYYNPTTVNEKVEFELMRIMSRKRRMAYIREEDIQDAVASLNVEGYTVMNVDLEVYDEDVSDFVPAKYVTVPADKRPVLADVTFTAAGVST